MSLTCNINKKKYAQFEIKYADFKLLDNSEKNYDKSLKILKICIPTTQYKWEYNSESI